MAGVKDIFTEQWSPTKSMSRNDLKAECEVWRMLWEWIDQDTKFFLTHVGEVVRIIERNYHGVLGTMLQPRFELKSLEVGTVEKEYSQADGKYYVEKKTAHIPQSNIIKLEFIQQRSLAEETDIDKVDELIGSVGQELNVE